MSIRSSLVAIFLLLILSGEHAAAKVATWTGDPWGSISRERIVEIAEDMIDVTWTPANTIYNYRSPTQPRTTFHQGQMYRGVAYNMIYEADDKQGFLGKVAVTPGGDTSYGNDCSGFISISWRLPRRLNTVRFEDEVTGPAILARSLGAIGSGPSVELRLADAFNRSGSHNILFHRYSSTGVVSMEQTPGPRNMGLPHAEMRRNWSWSSLSNYRPIRRNLIEGEDADELPSSKFVTGDWARTTASSLNLRAGPGTSYEVLGQLARDTLIRILPHANNGARTPTQSWWYAEVFADGRTGWLAESFLEGPLQPPAGEWAERIVDNRDGGFSASAWWGSASWASDKYGADYRHRSSSSPGDPAKWRANLPYRGRYLVYAWWNVADNRAQAAEYTVEHSGGADSVQVNQRQNGGRWNLLGLYEFDAGEAIVSLSSHAPGGGTIIADAVRFVAFDEGPVAGHFMLVAETSGAGWLHRTPSRASYAPGSTIELSATAAPGWAFHEWQGDFSGSDNPATVTLNGDKNITANFRRSYSAWKTETFTADELEQNGRVGARDDFSGAGIPNLLAYALSLDVREPDRHELPRLERDGDGRMTFVFQRLRDPADIRYLVEISSDLSSWLELPSASVEWAISEHPENHTEIVRVTFPADGDGGPSFVRLRVEQD